MGRSRLRRKRRGSRSIDWVIAYDVGVTGIETTRPAAVHALTIRYGQRHEHELDCARQLAKKQGAVKHAIIDLDLRTFGGSALTADIDVPKNRSDDEISHGIPVTYVPARNIIFLSMALAFAETVGARDIFIGVNAVDYSGYPDCRPAFIEAFQRAANLGTKAGDEGAAIVIHTPLMKLSKAEIIRRGRELGVDFALTSTCYDPATDGSACGECDACHLRLHGFAEVGLADPARYVAVSDQRR
jgi:7-cyano-7-deazaguanine synthase